MFLLGLLASTAFLRGAVDPNHDPKWMVLAVGIPLVFLWRRERVPAVLSGFGLLTVLVLAMTLLWTPDVGNGVYDLVHALILAMAFCLGASTPDLKPLWKGIGVGVLVSLLVSVAQYLGHSPVVEATPIAGLFVNKNLLAEAGLVVLFTAPSFWLAIFGLVAVLIGTSKAVWIAALVTGALIVGKRWALAVAAACIAVVGVLMAFDALPSLTIRFGIWAEAMREFTVFGNGLGSYYTNHPYFEFAHSEPIQLVYELGIFVALPAALLAYVLKGKFDDQESHVLAAIMLVGLASFPLHVPLTGFAAAVAAGSLASRRGFVLDALARAKRCYFEDFRWLGSNEGAGGSHDGLRASVLSEPLYPTHKGCAQW